MKQQAAYENKTFGRTGEIGQIDERIRGGVVADSQGRSVGSHNSGRGVSRAGHRFSCSNVVTDENGLFVCIALR